MFAARASFLASYGSVVCLVPPKVPTFMASKSEDAPRLRLGEGERGFESVREPGLLAQGKAL